MFETQEALVQIPISIGQMLPIIGWLIGSIVYLLGIIIAFFAKQQNTRIETIEQFRADHDNEHKRLEEKCRGRHDYKGVNRRKVEEIIE